MTSYFDYFCKNIDRDNAKASEQIKGTCYSMCPMEEVKLREEENLIHILEVLGMEKKLVKCYSRSAADSNMAKPHLLRPYAVLNNTVDYLLLDVMRRTDVPTSVLYYFINDRLRAVRQDMTIQRLMPQECTGLLEPMVRFYVYFGYRLSEHPLNDFDPVLNKKYLLECIKWVLSCCDSVHKPEPSAEVDELSSFFSNLGIKTRNCKNLTCDRPLMESLYILCNLNDVHPLFRYLTLPKDIKSVPIVELSYKIASANIKGNYVRVCRLAERLCPLTYCAISVQMPTIQRQALKVMSHAYSSKQLTVPTGALRRWLWFASEADALATCGHYGLPAEGAGVRFSKAEFKTDVALHQPKKHYIHEDKLNMDIENILTYSGHI